MKMKIVLLLLAAEGCRGRNVTRIIRDHYTAPLDYRDEHFKELVDDEILRYNRTIENYKANIIKCIDKYIPNPDEAKDRCVGDEFFKVNEGADLERVKIASLFESLLDVAFNENCMQYEERYDFCVEMLTDTKFLMNNGYEVVDTLTSNREKYIDKTITFDIFIGIVNLVKYALDRFEGFREEMENDLELNRAAVWQYFLDMRAKIYEDNQVFNKNVNSEDEEEPEQELIVDPIHFYSVFLSNSRRIRTEFEMFLDQEHIDGVYLKPAAEEPVDLKTLLERHDMDVLKTLNATAPDASEEEDDLDPDQREDQIYTRILKKLKI